MQYDPLGQLSCSIVIGFVFTQKFVVMLPLRTFTFSLWLMPYDALLSWNRLYVSCVMEPLLSNPTGHPDTGAGKANVPLSHINLG